MLVVALLPLPLTRPWRAARQVINIDSPLVTLFTGLNPVPPITQFRYAASAIMHMRLLCFTRLTFRVYCGSAICPPMPEPASGAGLPFLLWSKKTNGASLGG